MKKKTLLLKFRLTHERAPKFTDFNVSWILMVGILLYLREKHLSKDTIYPKEFYINISH